MKKEMLINVLQPEECRIAILEDGVLEELYVERTGHESYVGNIYKGRIVNIEPSIQAAFVDFGVGRNGFLHVSDVEPTYYKHLEQGRYDNGGRRGGPRDRGRGGPRRRPPREEFDNAYGIDDLEEPSSEIELISPETDVAEPEATPPADDQRQNESSEDRSGPEPMNSAEHRTEEGKPGPSLSDDDLTFSKPPEPVGAVRSEREHDAEVRSQDDQASIERMEEPMELEDSSGEGEAGDFEEGRDTFEEDMPRRRERRPRDDRRDDRRGGGRRGGPRRFPGRPGAGRPKPLIQDIFKRGQEVLVQVIKEGIGTKGPTLSTYISIAGRYLVLMPGLNRIGVSRKIADEESRKRLREILSELKPPRGLGFIIRTAGLDRNRKELQRDLNYLSNLWKVVVGRIKKRKAPTVIYEESDMVTRTIRDTFNAEIDTVYVDEAAAFERAQEFMQIVMPRYANRIKLYNENEPMFYRYGIEQEISRIQQRHVPLPNGGSIVIDQTEALVAIDVNSGNFRADNNAEETAFQMNLLAAKEIARQLRLRDLGGVIVNDFIDMRDERHRRNVERAMRDAVRRDRARTKVLRISQFGIIEMTRQRIRPSLKRSVYQDCPHCGSTGQVKTCESMSIDVMRLLQLAAHRKNVTRINAKVHPDVAHYLLNRKRKEITKLEETSQIQIFVSPALNASPELLEFTCFDNNNNEVKFLPYDEGRSRRR